MIDLSVCPTLIDGKVSPRHVDLRPYAVTGRETWVLPGGLTRVALKQRFDHRQFVARRRHQGHLGSGGADMSLLARNAEDLFWLARYLERCSSLARIIETHMAYDRGRDADMSWAWLVALHADQERFDASYDDSSFANVINFYVADMKNPGSVLFALARRPRKCTCLARHNPDGDVDPAQRILQPHAHDIGRRSRSDPAVANLRPDQVRLLRPDRRGREYVVSRRGLALLPPGTDDRACRPDEPAARRQIRPARHRGQRGTTASRTPRSGRWSSDPQRPTRPSTVSNSAAPIPTASRSSCCSIRAIPGRSAFA